MILQYLILIALVWVAQSAAASSFRILDQTPVLALTALFSAGTVWGWWKNRTASEEARRSFPQKVIMALGLWTFVVCAVLWINCRADHSEPQAHRVRLVDKYHAATSRRRVRDHYKIIVSSWRENKRVETLKADSRLFSSLEKGQDLWVITRKGFFGMEWIDSYQI